MTDSLYERRLATLAAKIEAAQKELRALKAETALRVPDEPELYPELCVYRIVVFTKWYGGEAGRKYYFAAIGITELPPERRWSITGQGSRTTISWRELTDFVASDEQSGAQRALNTIQVLRD